jgi:hypothetical protein
MLFASKWMELEIIMLSKVNQVQVNGHIFFSLMWKLGPKDKKINVYISTYMIIYIYIYMITIYVYIYVYIYIYIVRERERENKQNKCVCNGGGGTEKE